MKAKAESITRRHMLVGGGAVAAATAVGGAAMAQTPIQELAVRLKALQARQARVSKAWDAAYAKVKGPLLQDARLMRVEEQLDAVLDEQSDVERAIMDAPARCRDDYRVKLSVYRTHIERDLDGAPEGLADMVEQLLSC
ncbi:MAG: hypothetical protein CMH91_15110 [Oceanicaulis sp.]|nr:hypothetical protein [Oceanicaulis sp.]MBG37350.1 hypothetical protein [Oceanicaulis sp.]